MKAELLRADGQRDRQTDMGRASVRSCSANVPKRADIALSRVKGILIAIQCEHVVVFHQIK